MPSKGAEKKDRLRQRRQVAFSDAELRSLKAAASAAGLTQAKFMRQAVLSTLGQADAPKRKGSQTELEVAHRLGELAFQVKKLGTNINQMAKQANAGLVAVSRAEVQYLLNGHQMLMARAMAAVESVLK